MRECYASPMALLAHFSVHVMPSLWALEVVAGVFQKRGRTGVSYHTFPYISLIALIVAYTVKKVIFLSLVKVYSLRILSIFQLDKCS